MELKNVKRMMRKSIGFVKRNIYSFAIGFCVLVGVAMVLATVIVTNSNASKPVVAPTYNEAQTGENTEPVVNPEDEKVVPVSEPEAIIFTDPVLDGTFGMQFAQNSLVYSKTLKQWETHEGVDIIALEGTEVKCVFDGEVEAIDYDILYGTSVVVKHFDGLKTVYKSLSRDVEVEVGDKIKQGDVIGYVSASAMSEEKEGSHLHFEVIENGEYVDPLQYFSSQTK